MESTTRNKYQDSYREWKIIKEVENMTCGIQERFLCKDSNTHSEEIKEKLKTYRELIHDKLLLESHL